MMLGSADVKSTWGIYAPKPPADGALRSNLRCDYPAQASSTRPTRSGVVSWPLWVAVVVMGFRLQGRRVSCCRSYVGEESTHWPRLLSSFSNPILKKE